MLLAVVTMLYIGAELTIFTPDTYVVVAVIPTLDKLMIAGAVTVPS